MVMSHVEALDSERCDGTIFVSSISVWEIAILVARRRIGLSRDVLGWLQTVGRVEAIRFVPVDNEIAVKSTQLGEDFHKDRLIDILSRPAKKWRPRSLRPDEKIRRHSGIRTIW